MTSFHLQTFSIWISIVVTVGAINLYGPSCPTFLTAGQMRTCAYKHLFPNVGDFLMQTFYIWTSTIVTDGAMNLEVPVAPCFDEVDGECLHSNV